MMLSSTISSLFNLLQHSSLLKASTLLTSHVHWSIHSNIPFQPRAEPSITHNSKIHPKVSRSATVAHRPGTIRPNKKKPLALAPTSTCRDKCMFVNDVTVITRNLRPTDRPPSSSSSLHHRWQPGRGQSFKGALHLWDVPPRDSSRSARVKIQSSSNSLNQLEGFLENKKNPR